MVFFLFFTYKILSQRNETLTPSEPHLVKKMSPLLDTTTIFDPKTLDWPTQTKTYLINVNARILIIYMKIMNSVASFLGDTFEKCLRSRGHYFLDLTLFWNRR